MCKLVAVTNRYLCNGEFLKQIEVLAKAGMDRIILREKDLTPEKYKELAEKVIEICNSYQTECILHNYIEVANSLKQSKIHLPLAVAIQQKEELRKFQEIGCSIHSYEDVEKAEELQKEWQKNEKQTFYLCAGHIFRTNCKKGVPPRGLEFLEGVCRKTNLPVYAIGGIEPENVPVTLEQGVKGVCLMSWSMHATEKDIIELKEYIASKNRRNF